VMMISQEQTIGGGDLHVRRETLLYGGLTGMQRNLWVYQSFRTSVFDTFRQVIPVEFMSMEQHIQESVYVINCIWELFVLVGKNARGHRKTIRWAVELSKVTHRFFYFVVQTQYFSSQKLSSATASERPYAPTVHVLILPSQLPIDLRLGVRDLDEAWVVRDPLFLYFHP